MWIFWVGPIVGAVLAVGLFKFMNANAAAPSKTEDTEGSGEKQGEAETKTTGLDNDGYEIKAHCGWETTTKWQNDAFVTFYYNAETGKTVVTWEYEN